GRTATWCRRALLHPPRPVGHAGVAVGLQGPQGPAVLLSQGGHARL
ncbi:MAG: Thiol peroxidase, Bcp-type, partial [uncultured Acidimicrobiales bacterium]